MKLQVLLGLAFAAFAAAGGDVGAEEPAAAPAADAVSPKAERGMRIEEMEARAGRRFGRIDADGDGKVTPAEFAEARIGRPGRGAGGKGRAHRPDGLRAGADEAVFDAADADGDGNLTKEEWRTLPAVAQAQMRQRMFARLDANGDGVLEPGEFQPHVARIKELDADGDGRVTRRELRAGGKRGFRRRSGADG